MLALKISVYDYKSHFTSSFVVPVVALSASLKVCYDSDFIINLIKTNINAYFFLKQTAIELLQERGKVEGEFLVYLENV